VTQARKFGVEILAQEVTGLRVEGPYRHVSFADGSSIACHLLMLATGVSWKLLEARGAEPLTGRGIFYGAAMTEAMGCKDDEVYVVGAGNSAGQAAMYFSQYARRVVMLIRGSSLEARMSQYLVDRLRATPNVEVRLQVEIEACHGEAHLEGITLRDRASGTTEEIPARFVFVFIGAQPRTEWLAGTVALDGQGFVLTGPDLTAEQLAGWPLPRPPYLLEASVPGVFAAGDVRHESVKRVASAVGEGSVAVHFMHRYRASL
jgi:thioredoxin reductase (NADPH)